MARRIIRGALLLDAEYTALGIVRSLGRRGIPVAIMAGDHRIAATSRYVRRRIPWSDTSDAGRVAQLLSLATEHTWAGWTLFASSDRSARLVAEHHAELSSYFRLTTAPWDVVRWAYDKRLTYQLCAELGIDAPWTAYPRSLAEAAALDPEYPVILKPAVKEQYNRFTRAKAWLVRDRGELLARYADAATLVAAGEIMVQEVIPGGGEAQFSYCALCDRGEPLAITIARRTRQYPLDFGAGSTFVETVECPAIEESARRFVEAIGYSGLIELESKYDHRDGRYKLMDANPRAWAWHSLAQRAGVDFPYLLWQQAHGESINPARARVGERWLRGTTDVPAAIAGIRRGSLAPATYLRSLRPPLELALLQLDDPVPALLDLPILAQRLWQRRHR